MGQIGGAVQLVAPIFFFQLSLCEIHCYLCYARQFFVCNNSVLAIVSTIKQSVLPLSFRTIEKCMLMVNQIICTSNHTRHYILNIFKNKGALKLLLIFCLFYNILNFVVKISWPIPEPNFKHVYQGIKRKSNSKHRLYASKYVIYFQL